MPKDKSISDFWQPVSTNIQNIEGAEISSIGRKKVKREYDIPVEDLDSFNLLEKGGNKMLFRFDYPKNMEYYEKRGIPPAEDTLYKFYPIEDGEAKTPWTYFYGSIEKAKREIKGYLTGREQKAVADFMGEEKSQEWGSLEPEKVEKKKKSEQKSLTGGEPAQTKKKVEEEEGERPGTFDSQEDLEKFQKGQEKIKDELQESAEEIDEEMGWEEKQKTTKDELLVKNVLEDRPLTGQDVNQRLPEGVTIEEEDKVTLKTKQDRHGNEEVYGCVFVNKNGSRRISKDIGEKVVSVLEQLTEQPWHVDGISNFVIHYVGDMLQSERQQKVREYQEGLDKWG